MYCSQCGKKLEGDEAFCRNCGAKVQQLNDESNEADTQVEAEGLAEVEVQKEAEAQETVVLQPAEQEHESTLDKPDTSGVDVSAYPTTPQPPVGQPLFQHTAQMPAVAKQKQHIAAPTGQPVVPTQAQTAVGQTEKKSKTPIIIAIVAAAVALIAIVALVMTFVLGGDDSSSEEQTRSYTAVKEEALSEGTKAQNQGGQQQQSTPSVADAMNSASGYILPDSNSRNYSESELDALSDYELYLARNEVYARLGREFKNQDLKDYFGKKSWYVPRYSSDSFDSQVTLNAYEKKNVNAIRDLEKRRGSSYLS